MSKATSFIKFSTWNLFLYLLLQLPATAQTTPDTIKKMTSKQLPAALTLFKDILSYPNDTHHQDDIAKLVSKLVLEFENRKFASKILDTGGSPLLLMTRPSAGATVDVLVYLQADGQPVDPTLWDQPNPYVATLKTPTNAGVFQSIPWDSLHSEFNPDWRIYARSASDSKGPIVQFLAAIDAIDNEGLEVGYNLKVVIDTEEEIGSPHITAAIDKYKQQLAADMMLIFDGPPHASNKPTVVFGARGIATITLKAYGPLTPQHSGHFGNYLPNPAFALSHVLGSMKDINGRVLIPGFYDGIVLSDEVKRQLAQVPDDIAAMHKRFAISEPDKVADTYQQAMQYPSLNIRGLQSLKVGKQVRTLVPDVAIGEIDIRLVKESKPQQLIEKIRNHITQLGYNLIDKEPTNEQRTTIPHLIKFTYDYSYAAFRTEFDAPPGVMARNALTKLFGQAPILVRTLGGSVPISPFVDQLNIPAVAVPTVNIDNNQHAPNENLRLGNFRTGIETLIAVLLEKPIGQ